MPDVSSAEWEADVAAACVDLEDTGLLAHLTQLGRSMVASESPDVAVLSGAATLRTATRIGILSGSFNPLTVAHAELGSAARSSGVEALVWCCAATSIDKEGVTRATLADRLVQLRSYATRGWCSAVALVNRGLYVDQARLIGRLVGPGADIAVVVGFDKAAQIFDSRYYMDRDVALAELFSVARLLVAPRGGGSEEDLDRLLARAENVAFAGRVAFLDVPANVRTESSTEARALARSLPEASAEERLRSLLPPEGFALATTDGPYAQSASEDDDAYLWRSRWVAELARHAPTLPRPWPSVRALVAATARPGRAGAEVRRLVRESLTSDGSEALLRAIERSEARD
jgi:nicotinic acid mononucleotide adenylyltransferase